MRRAPHDGRSCCWRLAFRGRSRRSAAGCEAVGQDAALQEVLNSSFTNCGRPGSGFSLGEKVAVCCCTKRYSVVCPGGDARRGSGASVARWGCRPMACARCSCRDYGVPRSQTERRAAIARCGACILVHTSRCQLILGGPRRGRDTIRAPEPDGQKHPLMAERALLGFSIDHQPRIDTDGWLPVGGGVLGTLSCHAVPERSAKRSFDSRRTTARGGRSRGTVPTSFLCASNIR